MCNIALLIVLVAVIGLTMTGIVKSDVSEEEYEQMINDPECDL